MELWIAPCTAGSPNSPAGQQSRTAWPCWSGSWNKRSETGSWTAIPPVSCWQRAYRRAEDELDDPRSLALPDWQALCELAAALVARSADQFGGWSDVVIFAACTAARIGEVSGIQCADIDTGAWTWTVRRQTAPSPGGLVDKGTKGKRARTVPLIEEVRPLVEKRLDAVGHDPTARIFTGPRGGRITTAVLRDATHWDEVVTQLGYEHLRRHDLRHTA